MALIEGSKPKNSVNEATQQRTWQRFCQNAPIALCMLGVIASLLILAPSNVVLKAPIDLVLPKSPAQLLLGEVNANFTSSDFAYSLTADNPGLLSFSLAQLGNREFTISKLPQNVFLGARSLFYGKDNATADLIFTNNNRNYIYYATTTSGSAVVNVKSCGPFSEISDIHLTETAGGTTNYMIVADKGANTVYSYVLTPNSSTQLCTSQQTLTVLAPEWIRSTSGANPTVFLGYRDSTGLNLRSYQASDLASISAAINLTSSKRAQFGRPKIDSTSSEIYIPIQFANDSVGSDYLASYDLGLTTRTNILTCRSPQTVDIDQEGTSRYRYVFCPTARKVEIFNLTHDKLLELDAGLAPRKMVVGSDGVNRFISVLQSNQKIKLIRILASDILSRTETSVVLPALATDIVQLIQAGASSDQAVVSNLLENSFTVINLATQSVTDTIRLPLDIKSLVNQSSSIAHFSSALADSAYTLTEVNSNVWRIRSFTVGDYPIQVGYRSNRLYVLNRDSNQLSVVNLTSNAVTNLSTGTRPIAFDFDTTSNLLWAVNETSQSFSSYDITVGSEAAAPGSPTSLGFTPSKIRYQNSDATLYIGGGTSLRAVDALDFTTINTWTLTGAITDMNVHTGGVSYITRTDSSLFTRTLSTLTTHALSSAPSNLASNGTISSAGLPTENKISSSATQSQIFSNPFASIFSTSNLLGAFFSDDQKLFLMPYSLQTTSYFAGLEIQLSLEPTVTSYDSSQNIWMADSKRLQFQRILSTYQRAALANTVVNRPEDIVAWDAQDKIYIALRNLNAVAIVDATGTAATSYISVCQSPRQLLLDSVQSPPKLFVLCSDSNSLSVLTLTAAGAFTSQDLVATGDNPVSMVLNLTTNRLYIANQNSNTVTQINSLTNAAVATFTVNTTPKSMAINSSSGTVYIASENSTSIAQITSGGTQTNITTNRGMSHIAVNPSTGRVFASNYPTQEIFMSPSLSLTRSGSILTNQENPSNLGISSSNNKCYITYPDADVVTVIDETGLSITDVAVGDRPSSVFALSAATKAFVSNYDDDTLSILNLTTNAVSATASLTSGCSPNKMASMTVGGTLYVYVLCQSNDSIEVVNATSNAVGTPISLRISP